MPNKMSSNPFPSLAQGNKFNKYQRKIENSLEKKAKKLSGKEGFVGININNLNLPQNSLAVESNNIVAENTFSTKQQEMISNLQSQYQTTLNEYQSLMAQIGQTTTNYVDRTTSSNPYLGKNIQFSSGEIFYVTNQGVAKKYDKNSISSTLGNNGCPGTTVNINQEISGPFTPGATLPTTPNLVIGTPMVSGQSCGYEGENIYVNQIVGTTNTNYLGCYADSSANPLMTFIGDSPPPPTSLQNGSFSQPQLGANSYEQMDVTTHRKGLYKLLKGSGTHTTELLGWTFNGYLLNASTNWTFPIPYPSGSQCVAIVNTQSLSQVVKLTAGATYNLSFVASGSDGGSGSGVSNPINIQLSNTDNSNPISIVSNLQPPVSTWTNYTYSVTVPNTQNYILSFVGTQSNSPVSTAIQNVTFNTSSTNSGSYSYADCQQAAIDGGYQYFALQNANQSSAMGYCAVSKNEPIATSLGGSFVPSKKTVIWKSDTKGDSGNSATLNNSGSLSVVNSSGASIYSTPNSNAQPSNYYGCYADQSTRAMNMYNNNSQQYDLQQCQQAAQSIGATYFALQNSTSGTNAACFTSSDFSQATEYGAANNCTQITDASGSWTFSGGGWSNAIYNTSLPNSNYYLILNVSNNQGQMSIYRGTGPTDSQGLIWQTSLFDGLLSNPTYAATNGKYGTNWMANGSTLAAGDFISSTYGELVLMMQTDGNLTLCTFTDVPNCAKMSDGNTGGGPGANAIYNLNSVGFPTNMGLLAYIDQNTGLNVYPTSNTQYSNNYTTFDALNNSGNDISNASYSNATVDQCQTTCNNNPDCAGFVMSSSALGSTCYPKTTGMYPANPGQIDPNYTTYVRSLEPINTPSGISNVVNNVNSVVYQNYPSGSSDNTSLYTLSSATSAQRAQLTDLQSRLNILTNQLNNYTNQFSSGTQSADVQSQTNITGLGNYLQDLNKTNLKINNFDTNLENILNDSDIIVLQKNYNYLFWSILAAGVVLVSMNLVRNR